MPINFPDCTGFIERAQSRFFAKSTAVNAQMMKTLLICLSLLCTLSSASAQNLERGKDINATCAGCHGEFGEGGKKGEYPRIGGLGKTYISNQLKAFRSRIRVNMPMFPYSQERELPDQDIEDVSSYLASIKLSTEWPVFKPEDDALTRLTAVEKVMIIPRAPGDLANGEQIYVRDCETCHGKEGMGRGRTPRLVGQHTNYLMKQLNAFSSGERVEIEDEMRSVLMALKPQDLQDILAYLTLIQTKKP